MQQPNERDNTEQRDQHLTGDGFITPSDLVVLSRHIAEIQIITNEILLKNADVTGDGRVTIADLIRLARFIAGHDTSHLDK